MKRYLVSGFLYFTANSLQSFFTTLLVFLLLNIVAQLKKDSKHFVLCYLFFLEVVTKIFEIYILWLNSDLKGRRTLGNFLLCDGKS